METWFQNLNCGCFKSIPEWPNYHEYMVQGVELNRCTNACTLRVNRTTKLVNLDCRNPAAVVTQLISAVVKNRVCVPPVLWPRNLHALISKMLCLFKKKTKKFNAHLQSKKFKRPILLHRSNLNNTLIFNTTTYFLVPTTIK